MIDLEKYEGIRIALAETPEFKADINELPMLYMPFEDAIKSIPEMILLIKASCSDSLQLRKRAKEDSDYYYRKIKGNVHYFPFREGIHRMDMTHVESSSARYEYMNPLTRGSIEDFMKKRKK